MQTQTPCSDYKKTKGLVYFARMLDKIRLKAQGRLPEGYRVGVKDDPTDGTGEVPPMCVSWRAI